MGLLTGSGWFTMFHALHDDFYISKKYEYCCCKRDLRNKHSSVQYIEKAS